MLCDSDPCKTAKKSGKSCSVLMSASLTPGSLLTMTALTQPFQTWRRLMENFTYNHEFNVASKLGETCPRSWWCLSMCNYTSTSPSLSATVWWWCDGPQDGTEDGCWNISLADVKVFEGWLSSFKFQYYFTKHMNRGKVLGAIEEDRQPFCKMFEIQV